MTTTTATTATADRVKITYGDVRRAGRAGLTVYFGAGEDDRATVARLENGYEVKVALHGEQEEVRVVPGIADANAVLATAAAAYDAAQAAALAAKSAAKRSRRESTPREEKPQAAKDAEAAGSDEEPPKRAKVRHPKVFGTYGYCPFSRALGVQGWTVEQVEKVLAAHEPPILPAKNSIPSTVRDGRITPAEVSADHMAIVRQMRDAADLDAARKVFRRLFKPAKP